MIKYNVLFAVLLAVSLAVVSSLPNPTSADDDDEDEEPTAQSRPEADDDGRIYKNPRNSPSAQCPRDEEQATLLGQKCLRKCSSDEDCKSKKKKCLCDGACGMSCIKPDRECPELEQPDIGKVTLTGRLFGDKAVYSCPHGYHVVGLQSRSCQADGKWAGQPPACKENIYCLQPPTIEHARHSALPEQGTFDLDATVQYNCHTGYVTNGFPRAKCLAIDGQASWYGPDISCEPRSCGEPGDVPHGWVTADCHTFGCRAVVQCGQGFELVGKAERYCQADGAWAPKEMPTCVQPCHVPTTEYGIYTMAEGGVHTAAQVLTGVQEEKELNETDPVPNGQVVHFSCEYGYNVQGPTNLRCWLGEWAVTSMPECVAAPCELPTLHGATYEAGYRAGLTVAHASSVNIACEAGRTPPATLNCHLGRLQPTVHDFCRPLANLSRPRPTSEFQSGSDIVREDISDLEPDMDGKTITDCGQPARVQGTLIYKDGAEVNGTYGMEGYPHGTEITFRCIASIMGEKTTWKLICEQGNWVGKSFSCDDLDAQSEELMNNNSCTYTNEEPNVVGFYNDMMVTENVDFPPGSVIISRCSDIGKYQMTGSQTRRCVGGSWDGGVPSCIGLNQENDYAMDKPPTILFRYSNGPIAQTNDGKLLVYPGTNLHMECLWMRRFGNPKWNYTLNDPDPERKYAEGWSTDPGRDSQLEYRLSILDAQKADSGVYRCETPARQIHHIEIIVEDVHCPPLPIRRGLVPSTVGTQLGTEIRFSCANGNALLGSHMLVCKASGNWSAPLPVCESVECGEVVLDTPLGEGERPPRVSIVSRGVGGRAAFSCAGGWALRGAPETVCLPSAHWAKPFPVCKEVSCPALAPPAAGYVLGRAPFRAGDVLQFHCNPEHTLHGRPILVCQDSGRWSDKPPTCAQACTYPGTTISGRMSSVKFYYKIGETVTFTCEPGYKLKGAPMLRCLKNRKWSNAIPLCSPISNYTSADSIAMLTSDIDAMLSDAAILAPHDVLKTRETPAILSPESYKVAVTRNAVSKLLRRGPIENYKNRIFRYNRVFRRDGER